MVAPKSPTIHDFSQKKKNSKKKKEEERTGNIYVVTCLVLLRELILWPIKEVEGQRQRQRTKHIDVRYHEIRVWLSSGDVSLSKIYIEDILILDYKF